MKNFLAILLAAVVMMQPAFAQDDPNTSIAAAEQTMADAREADAELLAPINFSSGVEKLDRARQELESGQNPERVRELAEQASDYFDQAISAASIARLNFAPALESRKAAAVAGAQEIAVGSWARAEKDLGDAAELMEKGRTAAGLDAAERAAAAYSDAELAAIEADIVGEPRRLLANADQQRLKKYAPATIARSQALVNEAERLLEKDRYETVDPKKLAEQATNEALRAIYIATAVRSVQSKDVTLEELIIAWDGRLERIANAAALPGDSERTPDQTTEQLVDSIEELKDSEQLARSDAADAGRYIAALEEEIRELDQRLGGASAEREVLVLRLEAQARAREQFNQVQMLFDENEALVIRDSDTVVLRLVGLRFASGSSELGPENEAILGKLQQSIETYPRCDIVIEGHTDSSGGDTMNQRLSQARADSVMKFLINDVRIPGYRVKSIGYGDSRPIANNETKAGREMNRRIDLMIIPSANLDSL